MDNKLILQILPAFERCVNTYRNSFHQVHLNPDFCHVRHSSLATSTANRFQRDLEFASRNHTRSDAKVEFATVLTMVQGRSPPPVEGSIYTQQLSIVVLSSEYRQRTTHAKVLLETTELKLGLVLAPRIAAKEGFVGS
ncbi:hypothetical protein HAX54_012617 [Datura stramonium]|uniref:Uncharacterized protein n=1 Tax=Datura stramonium TaxID=4076 RepID=A0ABS8RXU1_DATST|nr:hypothetical protein [Datura stramonium]